MSTWVRRQPDRYGFLLLDTNCVYALVTNTDEPRTVKEAIQMLDLDSWLEPMNKEMASLKKNET